MNSAAANAAIQFMSEENGFKLWEREYAVAIFENAGKLVVELLNIGHVDYVSFGDPEEVVKKAKGAGAKKVYFIHNHPNKCNQVSLADIKLTSWFGLYLMGRGIELADHFIVAERIISMKDMGLMHVNYL